MSGEHSYSQAAETWELMRPGAEMGDWQPGDLFAFGKDGYKVLEASAPDDQGVQRVVARRIDSHVR